MRYKRRYQIDLNSSKKKTLIKAQNFFFEILPIHIFKWKINFYIRMWDWMKCNRQPPTLIYLFIFYISSLIEYLIEMKFFWTIAVNASDRNINFRPLHFNKFYVLYKRNKKKIISIQYEYAHAHIVLQCPWYSPLLFSFHFNSNIVQEFLTLLYVVHAAWYII